METIQKLSARKNQSSNKDEMWALVSFAWKDIPQENISKLISIMPHRMQAVLEAHGGSTCW